MSNQQAVKLLREVEAAIHKYMDDCCQSPFFPDAITSDQRRAEMALEKTLSKYRDLLRKEQKR